MGDDTPHLAPIILTAPVHVTKLDALSGSEETFIAYCDCGHSSVQCRTAVVVGQKPPRGRRVTVMYGCKLAADCLPPWRTRSRL